MDRDLIMLEHAAYRHHLAEAALALKRGDEATMSHHRAQALLASKRLRQAQGAAPLVPLRIGASA